MVVAGGGGGVGECHSGAHGVLPAVGDRGHGEQFGADAASVVCGDARPGAAGDEFMANAQAQVSVAQRGVQLHVENSF